MITKNINSDIKSIEPKVIANILTVRQSIGTVIAGGIGIVMLILMPQDMNIDLKIGIIMALGALPMAWGWVNYNGLRLEDLIKTSFISMILTPPVRKYKTENKMEHLFDDIKKPVPVKEPKQKKKKKNMKGGKDNV